MAHESRLRQCIRKVYSTAPPIHPWPSNLHLYKPRKDWFTIPKTSKTDKERLIEEDEEEVDELSRAKISGGVPSGGSNLYSYDPAGSAISSLHSKVLHTVERTPCCGACCKKKRWQTAILANIGFLIAFGIRCNFGAAKVRMNRNFTNPATGEVEQPEFNWSSNVLGVVEGAFFYGYLITQIPGGFLASKFPANKLFGLAIGLASFINLLIPAACEAGYGMVIVLLILQGLVQGVTYPACHGIWRFWAPPMERSKLATTAFTGSYAGAVVGMPLSATLTVQQGWPSSFEFYGAMGIIWAFAWYAFSFEKPAFHPTISQEEKIYIETSLGETSNHIPKLSSIPWKAIFTSKPVWAIIVANFCRSWTFYLLLNHQLVYFKAVLKYPIEEGGWMAALPHAVMAIMVLFGGQLADFLRAGGYLSTTSVRKIFNCGGFGLEALFLLCTGFTSSKTGAVVSLILAVGSSGFAISGFNVNHLDIAPRYASILMGLSNGFGTLSGMICPAVTERLIKTMTPEGQYKDNVEGWRTVFLIAALIHFTGVIFYAIFASGDKQDWADPPPEEETWKPADNFQERAEIAGQMAGYGATSQNEIAPLPSEEDLYRQRNGQPPHDSWNGTAQQQPGGISYNSAL